MDRRQFRAAAAVVGVADAVDPSGLLDGTVRGLEAAMIRAATLATGWPIALATNGTVRLARGLTSIR